MTVEEQMDRLETTLRELVEVVGTVVSILTDQATTEPRRTFGARPDVFTHHREREG